MIYKFKGKNFKIPDEYLARQMRGLGLTKEQAIEQWLEDEDLITNDFKENLIQKSKENPIKIRGESQKKRNVKIDPIKKRLMERFKEIIEEDAEITYFNEGKLIEFNVKGNAYKLDLIKKRK